MITTKNIVFTLSLLTLTAISIYARAPRYTQKYSPCTELHTLQAHNNFTRNNDCAVVVYYAPWCTACKQMQPALDAVASSNGNVAFAKANLDNGKLNPLLKELKVQAYPTTVIYKNGKEVERQRGSLSQQELNRMVRLATQKTRPITQQKPSQRRGR